MDDFYRLAAPSASRDLWVEPARGSGLDDVWAENSEKTAHFTRRMLERSSGVPRFGPVRGHYGKRLNDLLWSTTHEYHLASRRLVDALESVRATGYETYPVDLRDRADEEIPGYVGLVVVGECGRLSGMFEDDAVYESPVALSGFAFRGLDPRGADWDGSDLFTVLGRPAYAFMVTGRVMHALRDAGANDVEAEALSQVETELEGERLTSWRERTGG